MLVVGCTPVVTVLGAGHDEAELLLRSAPDCSEVDVVLAEDWDEGMGASLRAGLEHLLGTAPEQVSATMVMLVDLPDVGGAVLQRVASVWAARGKRTERAAALLRATYDGRPGHPVVLGRDHWAPVLETLHGDAGAQRYLSGVDIRRRVEAVECSDLATGRDLDRPDGDDE